MWELEEEAKMHLVERMTQTPPNCMICGKGNTPDSAGQIGPFIDLERSVNWDDSTYLCMDCGQAIGALSGMPTADEKRSLAQEIRRLKQALHDEKARARKAVA